MNNVSEQTTEQQNGDISNTSAPMPDSSSSSVSTAIPPGEIYYTLLDHISSCIVRRSFYLDNCAQI